MTRSVCGGRGGPYSGSAARNAAAATTTSRYRGFFEPRSRGGSDVLVAVRARFDRCSARAVESRAAPAPSPLTIGPVLDPLDRERAAQVFLELEAAGDAHC